MHTVENAVIVPVFTLIIVALISVSGYMHDKVVMRNILNQLSIEYSRNITSNEQKALLVKSEEYIKDKTIFVKKSKC
ncbi:MAG: TadE family protein [Lachnospira sp.]